MQNANIFGDLSENTIRSMSFELRKKDESLLSFILRVNVLEETTAQIVRVWGSSKALPYGFEDSPSWLLNWLRGRFIPSNRAFVENIIQTASFTTGDLIDLLCATLGLSLTDDYWVMPDIYELSWDKYNLYDNPFSETLALVAFTGHNAKVNGLISSPEYTTNGMLRKCWRRIDGKVKLYKGGTFGYANSGNEPYSEFYAAQVAEVLGIGHVPYDLEKWKGVLCSVCPLFTSKDYSFVMAGSYFDEDVTATDILGGKSRWIKDISMMLIFDFIVLNTDRHFGNFGFMRDNDSGELVSFAPLFDHGSSLLCYAMKSDLNNLDDYVSSLRIGMGGWSPNSSHIPRLFLTEERRRQLRKLLSFEFKEHPKYNLPPERLALLSKLIRDRVSILLS